MAFNYPARASDVHSESGFTLVELLVVTAIIMILGGLSLIAFTLHKQEAEWTRAISILRQARTALEAGQEYIEAQRMVFTESQADGSAPPAAFLSAAPGLTVPKGIKVRLSSFDCGMESRRMDQITVFGCNSGYFAQFLTTCQGFEIALPRNVLPDGIC